MGMSRRELVAWLGFLGAAAGATYLGWLLFLHRASRLHGYRRG